MKSKTNENLKIKPAKGHYGVRISLHEVHVEVNSSRFVEDAVVIPVVHLRGKVRLLTENFLLNLKHLRVVLVKSLHYFVLGFEKKLIYVSELISVLINITWAKLRMENDKQSKLNISF